MIKYQIIYAEIKKKREERNEIILEVENIMELYKQLEKSEIKNIVEIKEI